MPDSCVPNIRKLGVSVRSENYTAGVSLGRKCFEMRGIEENHAIYCELRSLHNKCSVLPIGEEISECLGVHTVVKCDLDIGHGRQFIRIGCILGHSEGHSRTRGSQTSRSEEPA